MKLFGHELSGYSQATVIVAVIFLLACGMCGATGLVTGQHGITTFFIAWAFGSLLLMVLSGLVLLVLLLILPFRLWTQAQERRRQAELETWQSDGADGQDGSSTLDGGEGGGK